jgi:hypothetical protein
MDCSSKPAGGGDIELIRIMVTPLCFPEISKDSGHKLGT